MLLKASYNARSITLIYVYVLLQPENTDTVCSAVVHTAETSCTALVPSATSIKEKFQKVLNLFSECHNIYSSGAITREEIDTLGKYYC